MKEAREVEETGVGLEKDSVEVGVERGGMTTKNEGTVLIRFLKWLVSIQFQPVDTWTQHVTT